MEQAKLMLKDQIIRETLFHKKELQYKLDKLKDTPKHDLPLTSRGKTVLRKKVSGNLIDVKKFVKRTKNDNE